MVQLHGVASETKSIEHPTLQGINGTQTGDSWEFLLGFYDSNRTVLLSNQDSNHPALASLTLEAGTLKEVDGNSGVVAPAVDDSPLIPGFQVSLLPGDGRLFVL